MDTLDEITPENPVPRVTPSSDETPPPPQPTPEQSIAPPDTSAAENVDDEMDYTTLSTKEVVVMIALMRNQIVLEQKSLPLVPQPVGRMALLCQKEGKGEIYQRFLPSLLTLLNLEEGSPVREISLPDGIPDLQPTQMKDP